MRETFNPYAHVDGPDRNPRHSLDDWTLPGGKHDRALDQTHAEMEAEDRRRRAETPDVYAVAAKVLAPFTPRTRSVPRHLQPEIVEALERRGEKPTRANQLAEAARIQAQDRAAQDPEVGLALLLRAALLWKPEGGWHASTPRHDRTDAFRSVKELLGCAFTELALGAGAIPLEVAQNRARTRSLPGEVFVQASHSGSSNAKNAAAVDRALDARRILARSGVHQADVVLLHAWRVAERLRDDRTAETPPPPAKSLLAALRLRYAMSYGTNLPPPPKGKPATADKPAVLPTADEVAAWMHAAGLALHGAVPAVEGESEASRLTREERHLRQSDRTLWACLAEAEAALWRAIGHTSRRGASRKAPKPAPRPVTRVRATLAAGCL